MLANVNGVFRLTRDIELRYLSSGSAVAKLGLVNSTKFKKQDGTMTEESCFIDGTIFGKSAETANQYLKKGSKVYINAELKYESWEKDGVKHSRNSLKINSFEMLDSKPQDNKEPKVVYENSSIPEIDIDDEQIQF